MNFHKQIILILTHCTNDPKLATKKSIYFQIIIKKKTNSIQSLIVSK